MGIKVLVVDDTQVYRMVVSETIKTIPGAELAGTAASGEEALQKLQSGSIDLVLLDVNMPGMDGIETLGHIKSRYPRVTVVMVSAVSTQGANVTVEALNRGALEFIRKPKGANAAENLKQLKNDLTHVAYLVTSGSTTTSKVGTAAPGIPHTVPLAAPAPGPVPKVQPAVRTTTAVAPAPSSISVLAVAVSTGGPNALSEMIPRLRADLPVPVVIVQHMPPMFTNALAKNLDAKAPIYVKEAVINETLRPGTVYIAPGGKHMYIRRAQNAHIIGLNEEPHENGCRPAADVLFRSLVSNYNPGDVLAVVMTGMGSDGLKGVQELSKKNCYTLTQSESSCVVYGMPHAVDAAGLSNESVDLKNLAERINQLVGSKS